MSGDADQLLSGPPITSRTPVVLGVIGLLFAVAGLGVSIYLTVDHYAKIPLACPDKGFINCLKVTHSSYSTQFGIPLPVFGLAFFVVMVAIQNPWAWRWTSPLLRWGRVAATGGAAVMVLWLIWVELFRLDNLCLYCTAVHALTILTFILTGLGTAATSTPPDDGAADDDDWDSDDDVDVEATTDALTR